MSHNHGVTPTSPSRRSVVKGAAWAVPAVAVAAAAPTVAASQGPLTFTGGACKLPGNANDIFKGYVFELSAYNAPGPNPVTGVTVITNVRINNVPVTGYQVVVYSGSTCTCGTCTPPGSTTCNTFCTPDGATQRIFVYTNSQQNSQNTSFSLDYQRYECSTCTAIDPTPVSISSGSLSTPPATGGGGSCNIQGAVPAPTLSAACAGP
ncbi:hypothetical protein [Humibacillus xanthopallidus]|uniref:Uncharacterized protein n=1 Tax=Humibacillus xanthopallidus TaxID=412689 RepID=A0A543I067_9MICO|nr:hypothetical protein [Humibacillus xanthopallidus]TQM63986.1 hypothetical protein FBY41_0343 [Humibacillus xanthopallidus]